MLVDQMHTSLLWGAADLFATLHKAAIRLFAPVAFDGVERIMVFSDMQREEMTRRKVLAAC